MIKAIVSLNMSIIPYLMMFVLKFRTLPSTTRPGRFCARRTASSCPGASAPVASRASRRRPAGAGRQVAGGTERSKILVRSAEIVCAVVD